MEHQELMQQQDQQSALTVNPGVEAPSAVNPMAAQAGYRRRRRLYTPREYADGVLAGDRPMLAQAITLVESSLAEHAELAREIVELCMPASGRSVRVGITGVPGAGKSTFIEALGNEVVARGHKLAVLAVDPSSERTHGSILGDKTRMESLSNCPQAFIRPSPSAGSLGGVARKTRETIILAEAAGFDIVFVETVGVGQSEIAVHGMVDFFLLLMLAGAGDELQGIKRGIMEMADALVINKADGSNVARARAAQAEYSGAMRLFPMPPSGWRPKVMTASALERTGVAEVWETIEAYVSHTLANRYFDDRRQRQAMYWMRETIVDQLRGAFDADPRVLAALPGIEADVLANRMSPFAAAGRLIGLHRGQP